MKQPNALISIVFLFALIGFVWTLTMKTEETPEPVACTMEAKLCPDGSAVGRVGPRCEFAPCPTGTAIDEVGVQIESKKDLIVVDTPLRDTQIASPLTVSGRARGTWYFEASFPITVVDWDGLIIGQGHAEAQSDWMTEDFVPFTGTITFDVATDTPYRRGAIIFGKDNPSGLPQNDDALEIPVLF